MVCSVTRFATAILLLLVLVAAAGPGSALAQAVDPIGEMDVVYADSVVAAPGEDIPVRIMVRNDEPLLTVTVPISYNDDLLTLKSVSFSGSRGEYLNTKLVNPVDPAQTHGHLVVALVKFSEDPIPAGDGLMFTLLFTVSDSATVGSMALVDTLLYPPDNHLQLVASGGAVSILPEWQAGSVTVGGPNRPPVFSPLADQFLLEGDSLVLPVSVSDPDLDAISLAATSKPIGSRFTDNGDGTGVFAWKPDYVGPYSADGSPFAVSFWASDGSATAEQTVSVSVVNRNRPPAIDAPVMVSVQAGQELSFTVSASEPDFEPVAWVADGLPDGAEFMSTMNPPEFHWPSLVTDAGQREVMFVASDPQGLADSASVMINVAATDLYTLRLDQVSTDPGTLVDFEITLQNELPVGSFNLLIGYDVTAMTLVAISNDSTRSEDFETFEFVNDEKGVPGDVRLRGTASLTGDPAALLPAGDGAIVRATFQVSGNIAYAGYDLPVIFRFLDNFDKDDNTLTDSSGVKIEQTDILYHNGFVHINSVGSILIGDINLNGLAADIGDVIYFSNHFIDPITYPFNPLQFANSDVDRDGIVASIADLVTLINMVISGQTTPSTKPAAAPRQAGEDADIALRTDYDAFGARLSSETDVAVGALLVGMEAGEPLTMDMIHPTAPGAAYDFRQEGSRVRVIVFSWDATPLGTGAGELLSVDGDVEITSVDVATRDGQLMQAVLRTGSTVTLPDDYRLEQNYPNPFNPETTISFALPNAATVDLAVFNVLGRRVATLADGVFEAGLHTVTWDGTSDGGRSVASGVYFYRLAAGEQVLTRKMMLLK